MIMMISGVYGGKDGLKRPEDGAFSLPPEEEARLVKRRVAVYANEVVIEPATGDGHETDADHDYTDDIEVGPIGFDETPPDDIDEDVEIDLNTLSPKDLRRLGKEYGLSFKANTTKAAMIEQIMAAQEEMDAEETGESPRFDPSEAVV